MLRRLLVFVAVAAMLTGVAGIPSAFAASSTSKSKPSAHRTSTKKKPAVRRSTSRSRSSSRSRSRTRRPVVPAEPYRAVLCMDVSSGDVLHEKQGRRQLAPASLVKMMTILLAKEALEAGRVELDDKVTVKSSSANVGGRSAFIKPGEVYTLRELMIGTLIHSANDCAATVAEYIGGSQSAFVLQMNAKAAELGMNDSLFHSPHGLPPLRGGVPDRTTAYDMALLGRELVTKHGDVLDWSCLKTFPIRNKQFTLTNTNKLLGKVDGVDGLKTGFYRACGFNIVATGERDGRRVLAVVLGAPSPDGRSVVAAKLINDGFNTLASKPAATTASVR